MLCLYRSTCLISCITHHIPSGIISSRLVVFFLTHVANCFFSNEWKKYLLAWSRVMCHITQCVRSSQSYKAVESDNEFVSGRKKKNIAKKNYKRTMTRRNRTTFSHSSQLVAHIYSSVRQTDKPLFSFSAWTVVLILLQCKSARTTSSGTVHHSCSPENGQRNIAVKAFHVL